MQETDGQLLEEFLTHQNEEAFAEMIRRHGAMVMGVCHRVLRNSHDAEEAFQAVFVLLSQKATSLRGRQTVGGWLHNTAWYCARNLKSKLATRSRHEIHLEESPMPSADTTTLSVVQNDLKEFLDRELSSLPEKYRLPLIHGSGSLSS